MRDSSDDDLSQFSIEHRIRRLGARNAPPKPPVPKRRFVRELVLIGGIIALAVLLSPFADMANPDYPEARTIADHLDTAYQSMWRGDASPEAAATANGLRVYEFPFNGQTVSVLTRAQPTADGACYGMRTGGGIATVAVKFPPANGCVPPGAIGVRDGRLVERRAPERADDRSVVRPCAGHPRRWRPGTHDEHRPETAVQVDRGLGT